MTAVSKYFIYFVASLVSVSYLIYSYMSSLKFTFIEITQKQFQKQAPPWWRG